MKSSKLALSQRSRWRQAPPPASLNQPLRQRQSQLLHFHLVPLVLAITLARLGPRAISTIHPQQLSASKALIARPLVHMGGCVKPHTALLKRRPCTKAARRRKIRSRTLALNQLFRWRQWPPPTWLNQPLRQRQSQL